MTVVAQGCGLVGAQVRSVVNCPTPALLSVFLFERNLRSEYVLRDGKVELLASAVVGFLGVHGLAE